MKYFVERTCTVVRERRKDPDQATESLLPDEAGSGPLDSFRDRPAYVLLGPPGSGKTEAFKHEARHEDVEPITARDFRTLGPDPDRQDQTLYIDGLDETRAGSADGRTPFDAIRARLQALGRPRFRLSCREADWFGANDRERLKAVAPDGEVLVLRLEPLSDHGVLDILDRNLGVEDAPGFVEAARERGVDGLLRNPLNLRMLAAAVEDNPWPRTRTETFDLACRKLVSENNPEHRIAWSGTADTTALLDAAGDLCAVLLLAGKAGVTLPGTDPDPDHPRLEHVPRVDQQLLPRVLDTGLFALSAEGRLVPTHRQLAEFLAARRIADLIDNGLPVGRVLSVMTGFDGGIISEFRGLAAWLAAQCKVARPDTIERDPLAVVLYGDVQRFTLREKRHLLRAVEAETDRNPRLVAYTGSDSPLRYLVGPDLDDDIRRTLTDPARDEPRQSFVLLIVEAIRDAAALPELADPLMAVVRDDSWRPTTRCAALEAYMRAGEGDNRVSVKLRELLNEIYAGTVPTRDDDLLGTLLTELYPDDLPVSDLVGYLREPVRRNLLTRYWAFWTDDLREKSTIEQMVQLLDLLKGPVERVRSESGDSPGSVDLVVRPPIVLLRHLLEHSPESVSRRQLSHWLDFAGWLGRELQFSFGDVISDAEFFRAWLGEHPEVQKAIIEDGVSKCLCERDFLVCMRDVKRSLFRATPPGDYGDWCADRALGASDDDVASWFLGQAAEFVHGARETGARRSKEIVAKLCGADRLGAVFERSLDALHKQSRLQQVTRGRRRSPPPPTDGRFDELRGWVKANAPALNGNECRPDVLHTLATAYLNGYADVHGETPAERVRFLLGDDDDLLTAAMAGLRGSIHRADLPTWTEVSKLAAEGRIHYLAHPFMVGLEELSRAGETGDLQLGDSLTRLAVAIHFTVARWLRPDSPEGPPNWLRDCLVRRPDTVAEVWARCAGTQLRNGAQSLLDTHRLAHGPAYAELARVASVPLLKAFPVRCTAGQLPVLRSLLQAACLFGDRTHFLELIETKLTRKSMNPGQRVYWLTMGFCIRPDAYGDRMDSFVSGNGRRIRRLAEMTVDTDSVPLALRDTWDPTVLERLIRLIGPYSAARPTTSRAYVPTLLTEATTGIAQFIDKLAQDASPDATVALESLAADDRLAKWQSKLLYGLHTQTGLRREATYAHPGLERVAEVLDNGRPATAGDLWALAVHLLRSSAKRIRHGANSGWRQFWNVDSHGRVTDPRHENRCRDALVNMLGPQLATLGLEAQSEVRHADDTRSDIRVSSSQGGFSLPIEIKRSCHRKLWSAMRTQLMAKYTRDPGADGRGIYLVFWFGETEECRPTPRRGPKPRSAQELEQALLDTLSAAERRKIAVCVIDVSKKAPGRGPRN